MSSANTTAKAICVFCGSSFGHDKRYRQYAYSLGQAIALGGYTLVYGGGSIGLMGEMARSAMRHGGTVKGYIPQNIHERIEAIDLSEVRILPGMHERKAAMYDASDAFIAMPGGLGTLDELFEIFTWYQLGYHTKPIGLLNILGYFDRLLEFLHHAVEQGFVNGHFVEALVVEPDIDRMVQLIVKKELTTRDKLAHGDT